MPPLPNAEKAVIAEKRFRGYIVSENHPKGKDKARVIRSATGLGAEHTLHLIAQVRTQIVDRPAYESRRNDFGRSFTVDMTLRGPCGIMPVRTVWIYRVGEDVPHFVTLYPVD